MNAEISAAQVVIVVVLHVAEATLHQLSAENKNEDVQENLHVRVGSRTPGFVSWRVKSIMDLENQSMKPKTYRVPRPA